MSPSVSVCIPTYNGARYIHECIESVRIQTYKNMEIIVVDDQSEDETPLIVEEYARRDSRIRLFVNEVNLGLAPNWNRCVELSTGEWIKFVLQDDLIESECIEKMIDDCSGSRPLCVCRRRFLFEKVGVEVETLYHRF